MDWLSQLLQHPWMHDWVIPGVIGAIISRLLFPPTSSGAAQSPHKKVTVEKAKVIYVERIVKARSASSDDASQTIMLGVIAAAGVLLFSYLWYAPVAISAVRWSSVVVLALLLVTLCRGYFGGRFEGMLWLFNLGLPAAFTLVILLLMDHAENHFNAYAAMPRPHNLPELIKNFSLQSLQWMLFQALGIVTSMLAIINAMVASIHHMLLVDYVEDNFPPWKVWIIVRSKRFTGWFYLPLVIFVGAAFFLISGYAYGWANGGVG